MDSFHGEATDAGYTVLHGREQTPRGVTLLDTPNGQRVLATSEYPKKLASMQHEQWGGRSLRVTGTTLA